MVVTKSPVFWDITLCTQLKINGRLGGTCRLHFQGRSIRKGSSQLEADSKQSNPLAESSGLCRGNRRELQENSSVSMGSMIDFQKNKRHCTPEDKTLHKYCVHILFSRKYLK
jgi:hypothetical protein